MNGLAAFSRFELGRLVRSWKFLTVTVGFPVVFYVLFLNNRAPAEIVDRTVPWRVYLMVSMSSFGAVVTALNAAGTRLSGERTSGWARQLRATPLPSWSLVLTKATVSMLVVLPVIILVEVVALLFGGVHIGSIMWFEVTALMWATALPFVVLGIFVGFLANAETAYPVVTVLMFILGYFGGLFTPVSRMPSPLQTTAQVFPTFHQTSLGLGLLDGGQLDASHWLVLGGYALVLGAIVIWRHRVEEARGLA